MSAWLGSRWARQNVDRQFQAIQHTIRESSFPLTTSVLRLLADLTQTQLVAFTDRGEVAVSTLREDEDTRATLKRALQRTSVADDHQARLLEVGGHFYLAYHFQRTGATSPASSGRHMLVLFDQEQVSAARSRAAVLPLITGLSTIVVLGTLSLVLTDRLIRRLKRLQARVEFVANGNFEPSEHDNVQDEIGGLANAVDSMAAQLKELWRAVERQQSAKLLHQIAGGMAHQLRNTLTGARMALEIHARHRPVEHGEEVQVALREIQQAEDYIRRLLMVGAGQQDVDRPAPVLKCLEDVRASLSPVASHLNVAVDWNLDEGLALYEVKDGSTLIAAVTNLVLNAMQAGSQVRVEAAYVEGDQIEIDVCDNGPGVRAEIAAHIFEPFVSSKPEGLGLGLPLVRRAAEHLEGHVEWSRRHERTEFRFVVQVTKGRHGFEPNSAAKT